MSTLRESTGHSDITTGTMTDSQGRTQVVIYLANSPIYISTHDNGVWDTQRVSRSPLGIQTIDECIQALQSGIIATGLVHHDLDTGDTNIPIDEPAFEMTNSDQALADLLDNAETIEQAYADYARAVRGPHR